MAAVRGPDVSSYQGRPDWARVRKGGFLFGACKATEGLTYDDPSFAHNWSGIRANGLVRIAYHFAHADPGRSATAEADHFVNVVNDRGGFKGASIPALDIEAGSLSGAALARWVGQWCRRVEQRTGRTGLIYSGSWFLGAKGANVSAAIKRGWKLWSSAYGPRPIVFAGFVAWTFWQFTDGRYGPGPHSVPGIGNCDISIFNGTRAQLLELAGGAPARKPRSRDLKHGDQGADVVALQHDLNHRLVARGRHAIKADGVYGAATEQAKHFVTYSLGFPLSQVKRLGATKRAQLFIHDPDKRPKQYLATAAKRKD